MKKLSQDIVNVLAKKLGKKESTIKKDIYTLRSSYSTSTLNAVAQIYAKTFGQTVFRKLDVEDKNSLPNVHVEKAKVIIKQRIKKAKVSARNTIVLIDYVTDDYLTKEHISELNRAFASKCYTCASILLRKIIENKLVDILRHKFPPTLKDNKELYFDTNQNRFKDFDIIIKNFRDKSSFFGVDKKLVERIAELSKKLKDKANDHTHSWFHIIKNGSEISDDLNPQMIFELLYKLEKSVGIV